MEKKAAAEKAAPPTKPKEPPGPTTSEVLMRLADERVTVSQAEYQRLLDEATSSADRADIANARRYGDLRIEDA